MPERRWRPIRRGLMASLNARIAGANVNLELAKKQGSNALLMSERQGRS